MNTLCFKRVVLFFISIAIAASGFAQTAPWYIGAFSSTDGSKLLITESRVYCWPSQGKGYILGDYSSDDVFWDPDGGSISVWNGHDSPFSDRGIAELELTAGKTITDFETVYKKNQTLLSSLRNEAKKLDMEVEAKAEMYNQYYTKFIESNKWLQGVWVMKAGLDEPHNTYLFLFPQGVFYIDPALEDGKVWQLSTELAKENSDYGFVPLVKNDSAKTVYLEGLFKIDTSSKTITMGYDGEKLKKMPL